MIKLNESTSYDVDVNGYETGEIVQGGQNGVDNRPLKNLANRTNWLKAAVDTIDTAITAINNILSGLKSASTKNANATKLNGDVPLWDGLYSALQIDDMLTAITRVFLGNGVMHIGDLPWGGASINISLGKTLANSNYGVTGSIISNGASISDNARVTWAVLERTSTSFTIRFQEIEDRPENIDFYWEIKAL